MARDASLCGECSKPEKVLQTKRDIPRVNGSSGAFIAIVVCLVFIIIVAWTLILCLLRDQRAFDIEQARRSKRDQPLTTPHFSTITAARSTWSWRITTFFGRASQRIKFHIQKRRGKERGWVQADNQETVNTGVGVPGLSGPGVREIACTGPLSLQNTYLSHSSSTISRSTSGSLSSVHLEPNGTSGLFSPQMFLPRSILPSIESQLSSPSTSPRSSNTRFTVPSETIVNNVQFDTGSREYVGSSGMIMRTLQGGTKFVEVL
ncbi:hypothetical protein H2248_010108 [Termitomyces sp. 'cryptogamus']|nr:hypothetical protein H2248_010108 [Termitomyces sp. 'cryptogamus']